MHLIARPRRGAILELPLEPENVMSSSLIRAIVLAAAFGATACAESQPQFTPGPPLAASAAASRARPAEPPLCGLALMTNQERAEHHARMRAARSASERDAIRQAHHDAMRSRARERGVTLDDLDCPGPRLP